MGKGGERRGDELLDEVSSGGGRMASLSFCPPPSYEPLTFLEEAPDEPALKRALPNQYGNPCLKQNPPGESLSPSVALPLSDPGEPVV